MRVLALARARVRAAAVPRVLLAPVVALAAVQVVGLAGGTQPASVLVVTSAALALPVLGWVARQVLDADPDDQVRLSVLAVGGPVRATLAGLLAAYAVAGPLALLCVTLSLVRVDGGTVPPRVLLLGLALALGTALAALGIGAFAARSVAGRGAWPVLVLVGAPVLVAVLGLGGPVTSALVPHLDAAVRATNPPRGSLLTADAYFLPRAPGIVLQVLAWGLVVAAVRLGLARRRPG